MTKYTGNYIGFSSNPNLFQASGVWNLFTQSFYKRLLSWPYADVYIDGGEVGITSSVDNYNYIAFKSPGFLNVANINPQVSINYYVIGGGGGSSGGGGGGAGGVISGTIPGASIGIGSYPVTVGAAGNPSTIIIGTAFTATAGGSGAPYGCGGGGGPGGSGGGGNAYCGAGPNPAGAGIPGQGNPGGSGNTSPPYGGGGGGGKSQSGRNGNSHPSGGIGGIGIGYTQFPASVGTSGPDPNRRYFASGGSGRSETGSREPVGYGTGPNSGGGGSAGGQAAGSGIVIIRWYFN
jgi:hypothetical protein